MTFMWYVHGTKYIKYNSPHKIEHNKDIAWCYKVNFKSNLPKLETKKEESYPYLFKYINCKGDYQANSNMCPF